MSGVSYLLISPFILIISIPLTIFAAFTTTLAFSTLFFRAFLVYAELAAALFQDQFASHESSEGGPLPKTTTEEPFGRRKSRRSSTTSGTSNGTSTPKAPKSTGFGVYEGEGVARDFEGVGGWRIPGPDDEDELWTSMNSRLELPAMVDGLKRNHHRSRTSGSLHSHHSILKTPTYSRAWSPADHSASPEEYFPTRALSKSATALDAANIGRNSLRHKPSSSSSGSSQGSTRTLHLSLSNS